ncbi:MAG TPA: LysM peptidoglycan-binding domain-containing protein [Tissierellia bacterium]|jgi:LysM repeat protein|nr:LysM peptidoglycan-binding domain-containing protein [Tissierellia bacterium]
MVILNKYRVTNVKRFRRFIFFTVLLLSIIILTSILTINAYSKDMPQFDYITVNKGDTLWTIAKNYTGSKDIRETIYIISKLNNIHNATIQPGDIIKIPLN